MQEKTFRSRSRCGTSRAPERRLRPSLGDVRATGEFLSRSVMLFGIGSNDLFVFAQGQSQGDDDVAALYGNLDRLQLLGCHHGPLGCIPALRQFSSTGSCSNDPNDLTVGLDDAIKSMLAGLTSKLHGLVYSLANFYDQTMDTFAYPKDFGYVNIDSACCGSGTLGAEGDCLPSSTVRADRDGFVFWDRVHPSQRAAQLTAAAFCDGPSRYTTPINFKQLVAKSSRD